MANLEIVAQQLKVNNEQNMAGHELVAESVERLTRRVDKFLKAVQLGQLDLLEMLRERKNQTQGTQPGSDKDPKQDRSKLAAILAGIIAATAGFLTGILDSIKRLSQLTGLTKRLEAIRDAMRLFGSELVKTIKMTFTGALKILDDLIQPFKAFFGPEGGFMRFVKGITGAFRLAFTQALAVVDDLLQPFKTLFAGEGFIGKKLTSFFNTLKSIFMFPFETFIDDVAKPFKQVFQATEGPSVLSRIFSTIMRPFNAALTFVSDLVKPITTFFSADGPIAKAFGVITDAFKIFAENSKFMQLLNGIGKTIGRLFAPLFVIMTAYDTVKGVIEGFVDDEGNIGSKVISAIAGGIKGLINSVIGIPLDLIKSVAAWALGKFGFNESAEALRSFSFTDIINKTVDTIFDMFKLVLNGVIELAASAIEAIPFIGEGVGDMIRGGKLSLSSDVTQKDIDKARADERAAARRADSADEDLRMSRRAFEQGNMFIQDADGNRRKATPEEARAMMDRRERRAMLAEKQFMEAEQKRLDLEQARREQQEAKGVNVVDSSTTQNVDNSSSSSSALVMGDPPSAKSDNSSIRDLSQVMP